MPAGIAPDSSWSSCGNLHQAAFCAWQNAGYSGTFWWYGISFMSEDTWYDITYGNAGANDQISSLYNNRTNSTYINKDWLPGPGNNTDCVVSQGVVSDLSGSQYKWPDGSNLNDSISSINLLGYKAC